MFAGDGFQRLIGAVAQSHILFRFQDMQERVGRIRLLELGQAADGRQTLVQYLLLVHEGACGIGSAGNGDQPFARLRLSGFLQGGESLLANDGIHFRREGQLLLDHIFEDGHRARVLAIAQGTDGPQADQRVFFVERPCRKNFEIHFFLFLGSAVGQGLLQGRHGPSPFGVVG